MHVNKSLCSILILLLLASSINAQERPRDLGIPFGVLAPGAQNAITDVKGVRVGHFTLHSGDSIRTGATAILPHSGDLFQAKVPAAIYIGNGFGKLAGFSQVEELGNIETPILLTNTLSVPTASNALISYTLSQPANQEVRSVNSVVGETNDGYLNDIRGRYLDESHFLEAIATAKPGPVAEGNVGAGTGTVCFGYKGGIGTSSRKLPEKLGGFTVGVLTQTNFGGVLQIAGVPIGQLLENYVFRSALQDSGDGSCMMIVATDAPLSPRNLKRLAKRAMLGLARTGGIASNGSGDYVIAFSTYERNLKPYKSRTKIQLIDDLRNAEMSPLFLATIEATEEAIINSLFAAETMEGRAKHVIEALPKKEVLKLLKKHKRLD